MDEQDWTPELSQAAGRYLESAAYLELPVDVALAQRRTLQQAKRFSDLPADLQEKVQAA